MTLDKEPKKDRDETRAGIEDLIHGVRPPSCLGPLLVSNLPPLDDDEGVIMGIDEAGRGPVLGPMTYGAAYWKESFSTSIPKGYNDSKQMSAEMRDKLFEATLKENNIGFVIRVLHATEISNSMLRKEPYNLNAMSHDAAMQMVQCVLDAGVRIKKCYIDTVGREEVYKARLDRVFAGSGVEFVVEKKADAKYKTCSAASVLAKVTRDRMIENWKFSESHYETDLDYGSGYPGDPKCKAWIAKNMQDKLFCYPDLVRFSWGPTKDACKDQGVKVEWEADEEDEQQGAMKAFMQNKGNNKKPRLSYFESRKLKRVTKLVSN